MAVLFFAERVLGLGPTSDEKSRLNKRKWRKPTIVTGSLCSLVSELPVANVSDADQTQPIERQLYGTSTGKIFLLPESRHLLAFAVGRRVQRPSNSMPHC